MLAIAGVSTTGGLRSALGRALVAAVLGAIVAPGLGSAQSDAGVTDLSGAQAGAIQADDIVEALAVPRGTVIRPHARPTVRLPIYFEFNSADLKPEARELLDRVSRALISDDLETFRFSVEGHTDSVGSEDYNARLSSQRAESVKAFLAERGVAPDRLQATGRGEATPVAPNDDDSGRQRNRRVEIINLGASP
jgi:outer membrane protein OmpA-like peptidoglycan-associated protein